LCLFAGVLRPLPAASVGRSRRGRAQVCGQPLGGDDYLAIAQTFHTVPPPPVVLSGHAASLTPY